MPSRLSPRDAVAAGAVRLVNALSRRVARGSGTVAGGRVGLAISPKLLERLARDRDVVLVSGTNGKTTTTAMIAAGWGGVVATNDTGSNMAAGHVAALVASSSHRAVLEVDESWLPDVARATGAGVIVLLNLSRDQLDRANEVRRLAERWRGSLEELREVTIVANANDPLVVHAAEVAHRTLWCDVPTPWTTDAVSCPRCTEPLHFANGRWWSDCGFTKPTSIATSLEDDAVVVEGMRLDLDLALPGTFNRANAAMALTALSCWGVDLVTAVDAINGVASVAGRFSVREWAGRPVRLLLAKNPAGFSAILATLAEDEADLWVAINARLADGRDPSWLYDVPFEVLRGRRVYCLGDRRLDLATRLDYAGVDAVVVDDDAALAVGGAPVTLLANYTAFQDWRERTSPC